MRADLTKTIFHPKIMGLLCFISVWYLASILTPENLMPPPHVVVEQMFSRVILEEGFLSHVGITFLRIFVGFVISFSIGMTMGILMGVRKFWESFFRDYVIIGLTIPSLAWAVIGVLWFGLKPMTPVFATVLIVFPYIAINFWQGVKNIDKDIVDMGLAFDVSPKKIIRHIYIPALMPFTLAAARIGFSISWKIVIVGEVFGSSTGIGCMVYYWYHMFNMRLVLAWLLVFTIFMLVLEYFVMRNIERRLLSWRQLARL
jgi:NitT/TauT family transport system permease protein